MVAATVAISDPALDAEEALAAAVDELLSTRGRGPLKFVNRSGRDSLTEAMRSLDSLPGNGQFSLLVALLTRPARFFHLRPDESGQKRCAMVGAYAMQTTTVVGAAIGTVKRGDGPPHFGSIELQLVEIPPPVDAAMNAIVAELLLEPISAQALDSPPAIEWERPRPRRILWCGELSETEEQALRAAADAAGMTLAVPDASGRGLVPLRESVDLAIHTPAAATASHEELATAHAAAGGRTIVLSGRTAPARLAEARAAFHAEVEDAGVTTPRSPVKKPKSDGRFAKGKDKSHMIDSGRVRSIGRSEFDEALGDRFAVPRVPQAGEAPEVGSPLRFGLQVGTPQRPDRKDLLLGVTSAGRRLHLVVTSTDGNEVPMAVVTGWDPDAEENRANWRPDALRPTDKGLRELPPTSWLVT